MKERSQRAGITKKPTSRKNKIAKQNQSSSEVQQHGDPQPLGNGSMSLEAEVKRVSEMVSEHVERIHSNALWIVQHVQLLVESAQLDYSSFLPPTYILLHMNNDFQLILAQEQGAAQPLSDGARPSDLLTGVEDDVTRKPLLHDRINRLSEFVKQFQVHMEAFLGWSTHWLLVIATHKNLDLNLIAPSALKYLESMENVF